MKWKTTYLVNTNQSDGLSVVSSKEWLAIVQTNKGKPTSQRRYFYIDYILDGDMMDRIVMEVPYATYLKWNRERTSSERNRKFQCENYDLLSLNAYSKESFSAEFGINAADSVTIEEKVLDQAFLDMLRKILSDWKPWAPDLLDFYLRNQKKHCTNELSVVCQNIGLS